MYLISGSRGLSIKTNKRHVLGGIMGVVGLIIKWTPLPMKIYLRDSERNVHKLGNVLKFCSFDF